MDLKRVKPVGQDDDFFHLHDVSDNSRFRVAKKGLGKSTLDAIAQHFADGGDVSPAEAMPGPPVAPPDPRLEMIYGVGHVPPLAQLQAIGNRNPETSITPARAAGLNDVSKWGPGDAAPDEQLAAKSDTEAALGSPPIAKAAPGATGPAEAPEAPQAPMPPKAPVAPMAASAPALRIPSGPNIGGALAASDRQAVEAQKSAANTAASEAAAAAEVQRAAIDQQARVSKEWTDKWQAAQSRADAMAKGIASGEIDSNHLFNSMSTGQKLGAAFGMILSGLGSGMTMGRQGNMAVDFINKAIDRDIETQKFNLSSKQSLLNYYMQQGHNIQESGRLARADAMDAAAAQLRLVATNYTGQKAADVAATNIASLHRQAAMDRQAAFAQGLDNQVKGLQVAQLRQQTAMAPLLQKVAMESEAGAVFPDQAAGLLDPKRRVKVPGGWTLANTEKDRDEVADVNQAMANVRGAAKKIKELSGKMGFGGSTTQEGQLATIELQNAYQSLLDRKNAPRGPQEEQLQKALSNPTSFWKTSEGINKLMDQVESIAKKHAAAAYAARLAGGMKAAQGLVQSE